ncbi:MAG: ABC transporter permease [Chloroflexi bacterium]|nr:ABC transporter permease [Chloroflexota bacterium]
MGLATDSVGRRTAWPGIEPRSGIAASLTAFLNEVHKSLVHAWAARKGMALEMVLFVIFYFVMNMYMGRGEVREELLAPTLIGLTVIMFFHQQVNRVFWGVLGEIQTGTLEQLYLSPLPAAVLLLGRQVATILESMVIAVALYLVPAALAGVRIALDFQALVPMAVVIAGSAGFSLVVAGLTLLFKRIELLVELIFGGAFIVGGVFLPLDQLPDWVAVAGRLLFPTTQGIEVMREILLEDHSLGALQVDWGIGWLLLQPIALLAAGALFYGVSERVAKRQGTLARY